MNIQAFINSSIYGARYIPAFVGIYLAGWFVGITAEIKLFVGECEPGEVD